MGRPADRMLVDDHAAAVDGLEHGLVHHRLRRADSDRGARRHEQEPVAELGREPEIVRDEHDGEARLAAEPAQEAGALGLVAQVEVRRRLVEDQQPGLLGQGPGQHHPLALAPAQPVQERPAQVEHADRLHGPAGRRPILVALEEAARGPWEAAHEHQLLDRVREAVRDVLRHHRDLAGRHGPREAAQVARPRVGSRRPTASGPARAGGPGSSCRRRWARSRRRSRRAARRRTDRGWRRRPLSPPRAA